MLYFSSGSADFPLQPATTYHILVLYEHVLRPTTNKLGFRENVALGHDVHDRWPTLFTLSRSGAPPGVATAVFRAVQEGIRQAPKLQARLKDV